MVLYVFFIFIYLNLIGKKTFFFYFYESLQWIINNVSKNANNINISDTTKEIIELNKGLEISLESTEYYQNAFYHFLHTKFSTNKKNAIILIIFDTLIIIICSFLYWKFFVIKIKNEIIITRKIFTHFPIDFILRQTYILKYLQTTSSLLLK